MRQFPSLSVFILLMTAAAASGADVLAELGVPRGLATAAGVGRVVVGYDNASTVSRLKTAVAMPAPLAITLRGTADDFLTNAVKSVVQRPTTTSGLSRPQTNEFKRLGELFTPIADLGAPADDPTTEQVILHADGQNLVAVRLTKRSTALFTGVVVMSMPGQPVESIAIVAYDDTFAFDVVEQVAQLHKAAPVASVHLGKRAVVGLLDDGRTPAP